MRKKPFLSTALVALLFIAISLPCFAAEQFINYQGELVDGSGAPVTGNNKTIIFSIWNDLNEVEPTIGRLWSEIHTLNIQNGILNAQLGSNNPLAGIDFASPDLYLEINVDGVVFGPRTKLTSVPGAFHADYADMANDAETLDGKDSTEFSPADHTHSYTEITGNTDYIDSRIAELQAVIDTQQEQINLLLQALSPEDLSGLSTEFAQLSTRVDALETTSSSRAPLDDLVPFVSVSGTDIVVSGANLKVQNGQGTTETTNGTGNIIIGYNGLRAEGNDRTGSHNLIIGDMQNFTSYGGLVAGKENSIQAPYATIAGGEGNTVRSSSGAILGGYKNETGGMLSSILGGAQNNVNADAGTIVGGFSNIVSAGSFAGSILGGYENQTAGDIASVSGGEKNQAIGDGSSVVGGESNTATARNSSILGGLRNSTEADFGVVLGGKDNALPFGQEIGPIITPFDEVMTLTGNTLLISGVNVQIVNGAGNTHTANSKGNLILGYNEEPTLTTIPGGRTGSHNIIVGEANNYDATSAIAVGYYNYLGSSGVTFGLFNSITAPDDPQFPGIATIVGGATNNATGFLSSILGGEENHASGQTSAIVGGQDNIASGVRSTVGGGDENEAGGVESTVGGGFHNRAFLNESAIPSGKYRSEGL